MVTGIGGGAIGGLILKSLWDRFLSRNDDTEKNVTRIDRVQAKHCIRLEHLEDKCKKMEDFSIQIAIHDQKITEAKKDINGLGGRVKRALEEGE